VLRYRYNEAIGGLIMNYTIAGTTDIHSEIGLQVFYEKNGNKYDLVMSWNGENERQVKVVEVETQEIAVARYLKITQAILTGCYTFNDRLEILEGKII
jgi:hypothetical protein